jgi:hypothetical protein
VAATGSCTPIFKPMTLRGFPAPTKYVRLEMVAVAKRVWHRRPPAGVAEPSASTCRAELNRPQLHPGAVRQRSTAVASEAAASSANPAGRRRP